MIAGLVDLLLGCWHKNYSFPITQRSGRRPEAAYLTGTYVVCLDCGKEFPYDWKAMKVLAPAKVAHGGLVEMPETAKSFAASSSRAA